MSTADFGVARESPNAATIAGCCLIQAMTAATRSGGRPGWPGAGGLLDSVRRSDRRKFARVFLYGGEFPRDNSGGTVSISGLGIGPCCAGDASG